MAASASVTLPLTLVSPAAAHDARAIFGRTPGTSAVSIDAAGGKATFGFEFPGNIDRLVERLAHKGLSKSATVALEIPVRNLSGRIINPTELIAHLNASPAVSNAAYDGTTVSATVVAATNAMRYLYEEIIIAGLMPVDMPTIAGPQEFVL
ncbi:MAG: hypothetical protein IAI49_00965 [Candidatus Eremiobacteraeota bacterium]|nr:hypothetical protein [Candidatus Eremiobacteraeota bacterium]